ERSADPSTARPITRNVRLGTRRRLGWRSQARHGLRDARPHGGQGVRHVRSRAGVAARRWIAPAPLLGHSSRPSSARGPHRRPAAPRGAARMTLPGRRLRAWARRCCSPETLERLVDPILADLQSEYLSSRHEGRPWRRRVMLLKGYAGFWQAVVMDAMMATIE